MIMSIRNDGIEMVVMTVVFKIAMDLWLRLRLGYIRKLLHPPGVVHPSFIKFVFSTINVEIEDKK